MMRAFVFGGLIIAVLAGCGGGTDGPKRYAVSGTVTFKGTPLDHGAISFEPIGTSGIPGGATITEGSYSIAADQGLPEGEYTVRITSAEETASKQEEAPGDSSQVAKERIPADYNTSSRKTVQVKSGDSNSFDFAIP